MSGRRWGNRWRQIGQLVLLMAGLIGLIMPEQPDWRNETERVQALVGLRRFDFLSWEVQALATKTQAGLTGAHTYLDEAGRRAVVETFLDHIEAINRLQADISQRVATGRSATDAVPALQQELTTLRRAAAAWQPLAEAILEEQVADILRQEGFGFLGFIWPPVKMHMTPLPSMLIISPRDRIERRYAIPLTHGLSAAEMDLLETGIFQQLNLSAYVTGIGGLGVYPAMVLETPHLAFLTDTIAHEWAHHWLTFRPLGFNYNASAELYTLNETVASIVGREVGAQVMARYYAAPAGEVHPSPLQPVGLRAQTPEAPPFDFRAEMRQTRIQVDDWLAQGQIEAAEAYMEARRQLFVDNGYPLRRLNQAYFAFHGAYADQPGATGADPIGPTTLALRQASGSLREFLLRVAPVTSLADLEAALAAAQAEP